MLAKFTKFFKDDRKYFAIVFFVLILILIIGILTPVFIDSQNQNWEEQLIEKNYEIENSVYDLFEEKESRLLDIKTKLKSGFTHTLADKKYAYGELISLVNSEEFVNYSVEIIAPNGKIIAWNELIAIEQDEIFPLNFPLNEVHFYSSDLITYLSVIDTVSIKNDVFYLAVSQPFEKHYTLHNKYFSSLSFKEELTKKFNTLFEVLYTPYAQFSKDGRNYSFALLNNYHNKIGMVNFFKPSLNSSIVIIRETAAKYQSVLVVLVLLFLTLGFKGDYKKIKNRSVKLFLLIAYLGAVRLLLFWLGFPTTFISGPLVDPAYFASIFAGGIVKSPLELLVTNIFLMIIGFFTIQYAVDYLNSSKSSRFRFFKVIVTPVFGILFFYMIRGLSASIKSVIYDSSIRYFKEPTLIPNLPSLVMNLNSLIMTLAILLTMIAFILLIGKFLNLLGNGKFKLRFAFLFIIIQAAGYLFFQLQKEPLITHLMIFLIILFVFILVYQFLYRNSNVIQNTIYATLISSVIAITLLNHFNLILERGSLGTIGMEVNRANENLLRFLIGETLRNSLKDDKVVESFYRSNTNYDAQAFIMWSKSPLQRESKNSSILLFDRNKEMLGKFSVGIDEEVDVFEYFNDSSDSLFQVIEITTDNISDTKRFVGLAPIKQRDIVSGYIGVVTDFNIEGIGSGKFPDFLESNRAVLGSVIDLNLVNIFEFVDGNITQVYGDIFPSREQKEQIFSAELSRFNDGWINLSIYGENYITYILKTDKDDIEKVIAVSIKEKKLTWNLFNFFKIFILHSLFILLLLIFLLVFRFLKIRYTFKTRLLIAFLIISVLPIVILAVYNQQVGKDRSEEAIFTELSKRSDYLENHVRAQKQKHKERDLIKAFDNAGKELGISFAVYEVSNQLYNSREEFYNTGLFNTKLNSKSHYNLNYLSYREYLTNETINNFIYDAYYRKVTVEGRPFIIGVNDAFNKIKLSYSTVNVDVFLFGVYSFALIIIIVISTVFANQISAPIRRLTKATESVAQGDLSVRLENTEKGELKDLFDGFESMTSELQKNQVEIAELERENAWKEMARQVAHEIKNPLTPMKLSIQQMVAAYKDKKKDFGSIFDKLAHSVLNQIDNLSLIASEFSTFAKMPSISFKVIELIPIVNDTINLFTDERINFSLKIPDNPILIEADESQLRRMVINMIRNSIQAEATSIDIEISENEFEKARGLMYRQKMNENHGMLFIKVYDRFPF
ncbi:MAG: hypothetical protein DRQ13_04080 [Ignavibacteriae bacterium]|nr:MAG: hypothetical protein DRQ13_04080 [Ignavibacteriota bacterium]